MSHHPRTILRGLTLAELESFVESLGEKKFRAKQIFRWLYAKRVESIEEMTDLAKPLRARLAEVAEVGALTVVDAQTSAADGTTKYLFRLADGNHVEAVLIPSEARDDEDVPKRRTVCISTQVGCPLDCSFCATASMKLKRNLTVFEIVDQFLQVQKRSEHRLTNIVYMGMGEPMLNYDNVMTSVDIFTHAEANLVSAHHITISTAGIVDGIVRMTEEYRKPKLAISLHTLDHELRLKLMPIEKKFPLPVLLDAVERYYHVTRRRPTFEYILFDGLNDTEADVQRLVSLSRRIPCKVNIIPFHPIAFVAPEGLAATLRPSPRRRVDAFVASLRRKHVTVMIRSSAGEDIAGACGQLAVKKQQAEVVRW